jgi:hypothetical protein
MPAVTRATLTRVTEVVAATLMPEMTEVTLAEMVDVRLAGIASPGPTGDDGREGIKTQEVTYRVGRVILAIGGVTTTIVGAVMRTMIIHCAVAVTTGGRGGSTTAQTTNGASGNGRTGRRRRGARLLGTLNRT